VRGTYLHVAAAHLRWVGLIDRYNLSYSLDGFFNIRTALPAAAAQRRRSLRAIDVCGVQKANTALCRQQLYDACT
jgi:hypothetical protein